MKRLTFIVCLICLFVPNLWVFGGTTRASDGHLFFLIILGLLAVILGVMYMADYIKYLFHKYITHKDSDNGLQA